MAKKSQAQENIDLFIDWANELKPGEKLIVFAKITASAVTICNHGGSQMTRAGGYGYDRAGTALEALCSRLPGGLGGKSLLRWSDPDHAELPCFTVRRLLCASDFAKIPISVWEIVRK